MREATAHPSLAKASASAGVVSASSRDRVGQSELHTTAHELSTTVSPTRCHAERSPPPCRRGSSAQAVPRAAQVRAERPRATTRRRRRRAHAARCGRRPARAGGVAAPSRGARRERLAPRRRPAQRRPGVTGARRRYGDGALGDGGGAVSVELVAHCGAEVKRRSSQVLERARRIECRGSGWRTRFNRRRGATSARATSCSLRDRGADTWRLGTALARRREVFDGLELDRQAGTDAALHMEARGARRRPRRPCARQPSQHEAA